MRDEAIRTVRLFNRTVAERIGAYNDRFLGRGRPYGESRTLWEIGHEGAEVRELRSRLGLDSGYVTRVIQSLERQGLVAVESGRTDGRVRQVRLTRAGLAELAELDRRSDDLAWSFVEPLTDGQRERLLTAMTDAERLLRASAVVIVVEDSMTADARWCIERYFADLDDRFESGFDAGNSISATPEELTLPRGALLIARLHGRPVGCGGLKLHAGAPCEIKRMWVAPEVRGLGVGRRLLIELEELARRNGARVARLETNGSLTEAIQLYRSSGYREVPAFNDEPYAHHWFEKDL
ncbi:MAG TPA: helix-turn-helix domain-containing GNAT family N-acetyltransferase [Candidatus Dormibacteraeota bacterium]